MSKEPEIGGNPLPLDVQAKLGEFSDWLDKYYEVDQGSTALYWLLTYTIAQRIRPRPEHDKNT
jgi:hypothetical protein